MDKLTPEALITFLWVSAALIAFVMAIWALADKIKAAHKPQEDLDHWRQETNLKLDRDNKRLAELEEGNRVMCVAQLAILSHLLTGNGDEKLKEAQETITKYLVNK